MNIKTGHKKIVIAGVILGILFGAAAYSEPVLAETGENIALDESLSASQTAKKTYASPTKVSNVRLAYWLRNSKKLRATWDTQNVAGYEYVFMDSNGKELAKAFTTKNYYERTLIKNNKYYLLKVRAVSYVDGSIVYGEYSDVSVLFAPPMIQSYNYGSSFKLYIDNGKMKLSLKKPKYAEGYRVYVSKSRDTGYKLVKKVNKKSKVNITVNKFGKKKYKKEGTYYVYVQGIKTRGGRTYYSGISYVWEYKNGKVRQTYYHGKY